MIACESLLQSRDDGDTTRNRCAIFEVTASLRGEPLQLNAVIGDQFLVRSNDALAGINRTPHPGACRIQSAYEFDDNVHTRSEHLFPILAPCHARRYPIYTLAR